LGLKPAGAKFFMKTGPRWGVVFLYVSILYGTLGYARQWGGMLRENGMLHRTTLSFLLLGTALGILWRWSGISTRMRLLRLALMAGLAGVAALLELPEERLHLIEYGVLGWLAGWAVSGSFPWPGWWPLGVAVAWCAGTGDELLQSILPDRVFDPRDILLNAGASLAGLGLFETQRRRKV